MVAIPISQQPSKSLVPHSPVHCSFPSDPIPCRPSVFRLNDLEIATHLIKVDNRLPELILRLVEIPHADFTKVTRVILVEICPMMMLSSGHTAATGMFSMLAYSAVAGGDMAATVMENGNQYGSLHG